MIYKNSKLNVIIILRKYFVDKNTVKKEGGGANKLANGIPFRGYPLHIQTF